MRPRPARLPAGAMLAHFTRASARATALDNLVMILREGAVRGARRMVRGGRDVVCLFDVALADLPSLLERRNRRRYEPFGIAIDKRYAFEKGARPAIYLPWREAARILGPDEMWRVAGIELGASRTVDWTFEREWRLAGDLVLEPARTVALVETWRDADDVYEGFNGKPPCAGVLPLDALLAGHR